MIKHYRKIAEPAYGSLRPYAKVEDMPQEYLSDISRYRSAWLLETVGSLIGEWMPCDCYHNMKGIRTTMHLIATKDGEHIPVRVYHPEEDVNCPVLIYYHGGAFCMNNIDVYDQVCRYLAAYENMVVIAPEYRLAPEYRFPVGVEDAYKTLLWVAEYFSMSTRIFIGGDSSGGNFCAVVALMARDRKGPALAGQIMIYPVVIFEPDIRMKSEERYGTGYYLEYDSQKKPLFFYYDEEDAGNPYVSPLCADSLSELPPALVLCAGCCPLLDQGLMYAARLSDEGSEVEYHIYEGMLHGFINHPYRETFDALYAIGEFIRHHR
jgi:acetyl esterase